MLCGCRQKVGDIQQSLDQSLTRVLSYEPGYPNYNKDYYSYYIEPSIGRLEADTTSNLFVLDGVRFLMNVNVSAIVNEKYYRSASSEDAPLANMQVIAQASGEYEDFLHDKYPFAVWLRRVDGYVTIALNAGYMEFSALTDDAHAVELASAMLEVARSVKVNKNKVLTDYAISETIDYKGKQVALFENVAPESGTLEELFSESGDWMNEGGESYLGILSGEFTGDDAWDSSMGPEEDLPQDENGFVSEEEVPLDGESNENTELGE